MPGWGEAHRRCGGGYQPIGVPMAGIDKSTARVIAVIALLFVAAWALRGYLPGGEPASDRQRPPSNPAALVVDVALLSASVAIIGIAIIARVRNRQARRQGPGQLPLSRGTTMGRLTWRTSLIALALAIGWLLLIMLLMRLGVQGPAEQSPSGATGIADPGNAPPTTTNAMPRQPDSPDDPGASVVGYLVPPMLILMALIVVGSAIVSRRQRRLATSQATDGGLPEAPAHVGAAESLARAAEVGLAEIGDLTREPREAIIACYAAMERELTHVPGAVPLDCDTPSEVLARAVDNHALHAESASQLVELFEEARFSPHVMNEGHRDTAVDALRLVLADLRSMA
jgi:Tfp pilus assembly protein PilX